ADALEIGEADKAKGRGQPRRITELGRLAEAHGGRAVEEEMQVQILFVHEELEIEPVEPAVDVPVDIAKVVARSVGAIVGELDAHALVRTLALTARAASKSFPRDESEALELNEKLRRQEILGPGGGGHGLSLVEGLEVVLHLPVVVAGELLPRHVFFHLLPVLAEHITVLEPRRHVAHTSSEIGVHAV